MANRKVSIITPAYNAEEFIGEAIDSVLSQEYKNWEHIIVDDCSQDNTFSILQKYSQLDSRINALKNENNLGPALTRNVAIEQASGRYIAFLDSDDVWLSNKLEVQINFMEKKDLKLTYSSYFIIDENGNTNAEYIAPQKITYKKLLKSCFIGNLTGIYDTSYFGKRFLTDQGHEDYILWLELMKEVSDTLGIEKKLGKYRKTSSGISSNKFKTAKWQWDIYREVEKIGFFSSVYLMCNYAYYGLKKYLGY